MAKSDVTPTDEQQAIVEATTASADSLMIEAYAGCAKTTSLELLGRRVRTPALALAFNKSIATELQSRFAANFEVKTMNGFGFGALRRAVPAVTNWTIDDRKVGKIVSQIAKDQKVDLASDEWDGIRRGVTAAQNAGFVPNGGIDKDFWAGLAADNWLALDEQAIWLADLALRENNTAIGRGIISFDDQVYWPTVNPAISLPKFPAILVDEAQDLSPLQHEMLRKATGANSRLFICGDTRQAIYQFRGADSASMAKISALRPSWLRRPLTLTFRCPKAIVARQQGHAPGFRAADRNAEGRVLRWPHDHLLQPTGHWSWADIEAARPEPHGTLAVLCRNNAPLFSLAFKLLRAGIGVVMLGRDLGKGLKALVAKLAGKADLPLGQFVEKLNRWYESETELARLNDKPSQADSATDRMDCLMAIASGAQSKTTGELLAAIDRIFARERGTVTLASIHKSKGLEWDLVLHLDPWRIPSKQAQRAASRGDSRGLEQEWNLRYVAETRSKHTLIEAGLDDFEGED
jgi:superfamily I DNA/RNA helicase